MLPNEYQAACQLTESMPDDAMRERAYNTREFWHALAKHMTEIGNSVDILKRYVFYGKTPKSTDPDKMKVLSTALQNTEDWDETIRGHFFQTDADYMLRLLHGWCGLVTEIGELSEGIQKLPVDKDGSLLDSDMIVKGGEFNNIKEEGGDIEWYMSLIYNALGIEKSDVMESNIRKLKARYPNKFNSEDAVNRDIGKEQYALESTSSVTLNVPLVSDQPLQVTLKCCDCGITFKMPFDRTITTDAERCPSCQITKDNRDRCSAMHDVPNRIGLDIPVDTSDDYLGEDQ